LKDRRGAGYGPVCARKPERVTSRKAGIATSTLIAQPRQRWQAPWPDYRRRSKMPECRSRDGPCRMI
jgi:hypothetical protein